MFVALRPEPEDLRQRWQLWVKKPRAKDGYIARKKFPDFEVLRHSVAELPA